VESSTKSAERNWRLRVAGNRNDKTTTPAHQFGKKSLSAYAPRAESALIVAMAFLLFLIHSSARNIWTNP
jgi:hypothetical protein